LIAAKRTSSPDVPSSRTITSLINATSSFGLPGLFLGPVIMALLLTIWREWIGGED
jgi:predicted PurR-regulated permease PerM